MAELRPITALLEDASPLSRHHGVLLLVIKGPDRGTSVALDAPITIGSSAECRLVLTDPTVSGVHAELRLDGGEIVVVDRGSTNGCVIGGARIERATVGFGTELKLGRTVIKIVPDEEFLTPAPSTEPSFGTLVGADARMRQMFTLLADAAPTNATVLIEGETGTGKELIAEELHRHSARSGGPFIVFDCGSVPRELVASILFGHVKGAFTGALTDRRGVFAEAHGGTLFLDEIGEMAIDLQPALLRALDKRAVCRVGANTFDKVDVRVLAATNRDLRAEVAAKRFREDLYYRLAVIRLEVPPLRARGSDIALLVEHFRRKLGPSLVLDSDDIARLVRHGWPGNVRTASRGCPSGPAPRSRRTISSGLGLGGCVAHETPSCIISKGSHLQYVSKCNIAIFMFEQLGLDLTARTWGGKREGAGRKKSGTRHDPDHRSRPEHVGRYPVHIVLRVRREVGRLRKSKVYAGARESLKAIAERIAFRVVHMSIQHNHIHFLVEASDSATLESGMRGLAISLARRINKSLGRKGKVFAFRYHSTTLTSPRQTRNALAYVLNNWRRHREDERGLEERTMILDPYSSAIAFRGWADFRLEHSDPHERVGLLDDEEPLPVASPQTWLLNTGWELARRPIRTSDTPGPLA